MARKRNPDAVAITVIPGGVSPTRPELTPGGKVGHSEEPLVQIPMALPSGNTDFPYTVDADEEGDESIPNNLPTISANQPEGPSVKVDGDANRAEIVRTDAKTSEKVKARAKKVAKSRANRTLLDGQVEQEREGSAGAGPEPWRDGNKQLPSLLE